MLLIPLFLLALFGADWLTPLGDRDGSRWQRDERSINASNAGQLRLLWKRRLDAGPLSPPVILGQMKTHRGKIELVFVNSGSGMLYALDGDFSHIFWSRRIGPAWPARRCGPEAGSVAPRPEGAPSEDDEDDDAPQPLRPLSVLSADGLLHSIHPGVGDDLGTPVKATIPESCGNTPARTAAMSYSTASGRLTATRGRERIWSSAPLIDPKPPVVAGGVVFVLSATRAGGPARLSAFDEKSGTRLWSSGAAIAGRLGPGGLAVANGHLIFAAGDGFVYCFGLPEER